MDVVYVSPPEGYNKEYIKVLSELYPHSSYLTPDIRIINHLARNNKIRAFYIGVDKKFGVNTYVGGINYDRIDKSMRYYNQHNGPNLGGICRPTPLSIRSFM